MRTKEEVVFITFEQAQDLVERIADRCTNFDYEISEPEKEAMAQLLSDIGVRVSDLIDVSCLADNYVFNSEIVKGDKEAEAYTHSSLDDALFSWEENGEKCYCIQW